MRRYAYFILFLVVLVTPFLLRLAVGVKKAQTKGPGGPAGEPLRLVIVSPHNEGIRREFGDAFSEYMGRPVFLDFRSYGGGASEIVKFFDSSQKLFEQIHTYNVDLTWGGGDFLFDKQLKPHLEPITLPPDVMAAAYPTPDIAGVNLYDRKDGAWYGTALSSFGIVYNKDVVRYLAVPEEPKTWADLADPKYRGWVCLADPTRSASARQIFMTIVEKAMDDAKKAGRSPDDGWADGMGLIRRIAANARLFADGSQTVPSLVGSGDSAAGMAIDFYGRTQVEAVGDRRMGYVEPAGATIVNPDPIALVKGAPNKDLALKFIAFVLSERGQRLWNVRAGAPGGPHSTSLRRLPIMRSVYDHPTDFTDPVNPYAVTGGFNTSNARKETFVVLGDLIQMSCMDLIDELRDTRAAILASPKAADLDARLGRFPFDQKEALRRQALLKAATPLGRLALQRQWTEEFRDEYRRLREAM